jgi:hypothetical protein
LLIILVFVCCPIVCLLRSEFRVVISASAISALKRYSVRLYLQLFVGGRVSHLRYLCLFAYSGVQHILCCVFVLFFFVLCILCFQFLWIVLFCLPLRYSLTFMYNVPLHIYSLPKLWHLVQRHTCRPEDFGLVKCSRNSSNIDNFSVKCFVIIPRGSQGLKKHNILIFIITIVKIDYFSIKIIGYLLSL